MARKLTTEEFIEKARNVHGDRYGYEKVVYKGSQKKVEIVCKEHGSFWQVAIIHYRGFGCPHCSRKHNYTTEEFIKEACKVHGVKYLYENTDYKNNKEHVEIICREHGRFRQLPGTHLNGSGCPDCYNKLRGKSVAMDTESFIDRSRSIHGNLYSYELVEYKGSKCKVDIVCNIHGRFSKRPNNHLRGEGCPKCAELDSGWGVQGFYGTLSPSNLYILKIDRATIKIGLATDISRRMRVINKESGYSVEKLYSVSGPAYKLWLLEQTILRLSNLEQHTPEVSFAGQSECLEMKELDKVMEIVQEWEKWNKEDKQ